MPSTETRRASPAKAAARSARAWRLPTKLSRSACRLCGTWRLGNQRPLWWVTRQALSASGGGPSGRAEGSNNAIGSLTPLSCQCPSGFSLGSSANAEAAVSLSKVWPGNANAPMRAVSGLAMPSTSRGLAPRAMSAAGVSRRSTGARWTATRACKGGAMALSASWYAAAKASASATLPNSARSPSVLSTSRPRQAVNSPRAMPSCARHNCLAAASPRRSVRAVLSTTSHNSKTCSFSIDDSPARRFCTLVQ